MSSAPVSDATKRHAEDAGGSASKKAKSDSVLTASRAAEADAAAFVYPSDWPQAGLPIDLAVQDLPHDSADTEWWYINGHVADASGREYSLFASFFRVVDKVGIDGTVEHAHSLTWAIVDKEAKKYYYDPVLDPGTPKILKKQLEQGKYEIDHRVSKAFLEIVSKGNVPLPDRLLQGEIKVSKSSLDVQYGANRIYKDSENRYVVHCEHAEQGIAFTVTLTPQKPAQRQGHEGIVKVGLKQDTMFYYFIPRNTCVGELVIEKKTIPVTGTAWYDHEFGGKVEADKYESNGNGMEVENKGKTEVVEVEKQGKHVSHYAWNWFSCQLDDGSDITATTLVDSNTKEIYDNYAIVVGPAPKAERVEYLDMSLTGSKDWVSIKTTSDYPMKWDLVIPGADCHLEAFASFENQEFMTLISKPAFWEGRIEIKGTLHGKPVTGRGFVERHGFNDFSSLDKFFKKISKLVFKQVDRVIPRNATYEQIRDLMATDEYDHFMEGVNIDVIRDYVIKPIRDIIDRGGKSWRSFACLLCVDVVGGDSERFKHWLAMPELMHVGSLIIDDIQDKSPTRRGGPSAHLLYGEPIAINAGTASYFLTLNILNKMTPDLPQRIRLRLYESYILTLRAAHAGQALDIHGLDYSMDEVVKSGDGELLLKRVTATHRLKSAVPAGLLARMGAVLGDGNNEQIEALGRYFEAIGIAFQIMDDVLNLRGFDSGGGVWKDRGEDIKAGKVTYPIAKAMCSKEFDEEARAWIWNTLKSKPQDQAIVDSVVEKLKSVNALESSQDDAEDLIKAAWTELDKKVPDSFFKMMLRAFGFYVLQRHY